MRNIFLEKLYTNCGGEASPRHLYKKAKLSISLDQYRGLPKYIKVAMTCFCLI